MASHKRVKFIDVYLSVHVARETNKHTHECQLEPYIQAEYCDSRFIVWSSYDP